MANLLNSLSQFLFSKKKRERESNEETDGINKRGNLCYSINKIRKKENKEKSNKCPHCVSEKYAKIYHHVGENLNNNVVRNIDFDNSDNNHIREQVIEVKEEDMIGEIKEHNNESNQGKSDNIDNNDVYDEYNQNVDGEDNETIKIINIKKNINEIQQIGNEQSENYKIYNEIAINEDIIPQTKNIKKEDHNSSIINIIDNKQNKSDDSLTQDDKAILNTTMKPNSKPKKYFLETYKIYLNTDNIDSIFDQVFNYIETRQYNKILSSFTKDEFITCYKYILITNIYL